jgi:hypothetical protein
MKLSLLAVAPGAALFLLASTAGAAQLSALSDAEMDGVTAGSSALANAAALALGEISGDTQTQTSTNISKVGGIPKIAIGQAMATSVVAGGILFNSAGAVHADTSVKW